MTRIAIFPAYDDSAASSRIRAYTLHKSLAAMGHDARLGDAGGADVVILQKRVTPETLAMAKGAKAAGALLVYDVDDVGRELWYFVAPSVLHRLLPLVDVVTTDTAEHRALLLRDYGVRTVEIVPDAIDYYPEAPVRLPLRDDAPLRVLWFGNVVNLPLFAKYARTLQALGDVEVVVITNADAVGRLRARFPGIAFLPWSRQNFVALLQTCALTVLPHDGTERDRAKSNNKMITSITWGVPAVVSRTPDYERTAAEAGVEEALFGDAGELAAAVERLRPAGARAAYLDRAQPEVWRRYSPAAVAATFLEVVERASRGEQRAPQLGYLRWIRRVSGGRVTSVLVGEAMQFAARLKRS